jgi:4-diphosphocytidyl-2-C-methyl-D-erythritol kinase
VTTSGRRGTDDEPISPPVGSAPVVIEGLAKLTLTLRVTGVRPDGYHLLESEMITLDLADRLTIAPGDGLEVVDTTTGGHRQVPVDEANLVCRALAAVGAQASVRLEKHIPTGGGLGGGSADAAAVLRWAGCADLALAARLGADVPFCLVGGRALVTGIGEVVQPLPFDELAEQVFTLLTPPFGVDTIAVYRAWDDLGGPSGGRNDLEAPALLVEPRLAEWRDRLGNATGQQPTLAGSGSTWWVPGDYPGEGRVVARAATPPAPRSQRLPLRGDG